MNNELRFLPDNDSRFFLFFDYAYAEDQRPEINTSFRNICGMGCGFRIPSRLGIIRMDYALHYYHSEWLHPMDGFIHLGLETLF
jgi:outer membrane protein assembly factor BamA